MNHPPSPDSLRLVEVDHALMIERCSTFYTEPVASRMRWPISKAWITNPFRPCIPLPIGEVVIALSTGPCGADYIHCESGYSFWLPEGGRTEAISREVAVIPRPKDKGKVVKNSYDAEPGDVFYREGRWWKQFKRITKPLPVNWDQLVWKEEM